MGGLVLYSFGDYQWMWYADIALSAKAALINFPIKEPAPVMAAAAAYGVIFDAQKSCSAWAKSTFCARV